MPATRPLPTVIGPTENALRALLAKTLAHTRISSYRAWVVLNALDAGRAAPDAPWRTAAAGALKVDDGVLDLVLAELRSEHLVDEQHALTAFGRAELSAARAAVAASTARLVEDLGEAEQETTRLVLDRIRRRAEELVRA